MNQPCSLDQLEPGCTATIVTLVFPERMAGWRPALHDLGFVPGETTRVLRRGVLGGDPLVVRVGSSTYALRCAEAACVWVLREPVPSP